MSARERFVDVSSTANAARLASCVEPKAVHLAAVAVSPIPSRKLSIVRPAPRRRLATLLSADVVGYSRLMQDDDIGTLEALNRHRTRMGQISAVHQGRVVNMPGDAILVEFCSAVEALAAAIEMQDDIDSCNAQLQPHKRMVFRIGLDLGDILVETDGGVYGNGVNVAARMEALAHPGGIVVSGKVFDEVSFRLPQRFHALGQIRIKNIRGRVRAYEAMRPAVGGACGGRRGISVRELAALARGMLNSVAGSFLCALAPHGRSAPTTQGGRLQ